MMNKKELNVYIENKLIKNDQLIASTVQWGHLNKINKDLTKFVKIKCGSIRSDNK